MSEANLSQEVDDSTSSNNCLTDESDEEDIVDYFDNTGNNCLESNGADVANDEIQSGNKLVRCRTVITSDQKNTLLKFWEECGMRTAASSFVGEAAEKTGLNVFQVKTWIHNYRASLKPYSRKSSRQPKLWRERPMTGYNLFCASLKESGTDFKLWGSLWAGLSQVEHQQWKDKARLVNNEGINRTDLDHNKKQKLKNKHLKKIELHCKSLEYLGCDVGGFLFYCNTLNVFGTDKGKRYFCKEDVQRAFVRSVEAVEEKELPVSKHEELRELKKQVQRIYNMKYCEAVGKPNERMPYRYIEQKGIKITGLPDGVVFRKPSNYGRKDLEKIVESQNDIQVLLMKTDLPTGELLNSNDVVKDETSKEAELANTGAKAIHLQFFI